MFLSQLIKDILRKIWDIVKKAFAMSFPALRQPKSVKTAKVDTKPLISNILYVIVTLRDGKRLVITSDAYHGILKFEELYRCVFCGTSMECNALYTQYHKGSPVHLRAMNAVPYVEGFSENLVKKLDNNQCYCQICNVIVTTPFLVRHIISDVHTNELEKAAKRVSAYTADK